MKKEILANFLEILFVRLFTTSSVRFSKFDSRSVILFQINVFGGNIKETTLARCFIKVTVHPSLVRLRAIRRIKRVHSLNVKWKISYKIQLYLLHI